MLHLVDIIIKIIITYVCRNSLLLCITIFKLKEKFKLDYCCFFFFLKPRSFFIKASYQTLPSFSFHLIFQIVSQNKDFDNLSINFIENFFRFQEFSSHYKKTDLN